MRCKEIANITSRNAMQMLSFKDAARPTHQKI
jgi:hypothetical protein